MKPEVDLGAPADADSIRLFREAERRGVVLPQPATVRRYGMTLIDWLRILDRQRWKCPVKDHAAAKYVVDHQHVRGWPKMRPEERRRFVRGLLCNGCNYFVLGGGVETRWVAENVAAYLGEYEARRDGHAQRDTT